MKHEKNEKTSHKLEEYIVNHVSERDWSLEYIKNSYN